MSLSGNWENLNILTKSEIIVFLQNEYGFHAPEKRKVNSFKWRITAEKLQKEMSQHLNSSKSSDIAKQIDELAALFNVETDWGKKTKILEKRSELLTLLKKDYEQWEAINKKQDDNQKFYDRM